MIGVTQRIRLANANLMRRKVHVILHDLGQIQCSDTDANDLFSSCQPYTSFLEKQTIAESTVCPTIICQVWMLQASPQTLDISEMHDRVQFVFVSASGELKEQDASTRTMIKRHVMRNTCRSRRRHGRKGLSNVPENNSTSTRSDHCSTAVTLEAKNADHRETAIYRNPTNDHIRPTLADRSTYMSPHNAVSTH